jgi:hypothetical protein
VTDLIEPPGDKKSPPKPYMPTYVTRRRLGPGELLAAGGVAAGVAAFAFYLATIWLERTPLLPADEERTLARPRVRR